MSDYSVYSDFDIEKHKRTFINYLEVIIDREGVVHYAVPSHEKRLMRIIAEDRGLTEREVWDLCPPEYYGDWLEWLCMEAQAVAVWDWRVVAPKVNKQHYYMLHRLKMAGLYKGPMPEKPR